MDLKTATDVVSNVVTSTAVVVGGIWAYFKFIRGRTFAHRAELNVSSTLVRGARSQFLSVVVSLTNTGLSRLPLNEKMKVIRLFGMVQNSTRYPSTVEWERISTLPILQQHAWLEAQEAVTDVITYELSPVDEARPAYSAYRVETIVGAPRRKITGKGIQWQSHSVIFPKVGDPTDTT